MALSPAFINSFDMDKPAPSQADFGLLVGLSQQHVSRLIRRGVLVEGDTMGGWIDAYTAHLRERAEARLLQSSPELQRERIRLLRERTVSLHMTNSARKANLAPVAAMERVLAMAAARIPTIIGSIAPALRAQLPALQLDPAAFRAVESIVERAADVARGMRLQDPEDDEEPGEAVAGDLEGSSDEQ